MISAIGGALGLFTGISVITVMEVIYWITRFVVSLFSKMTISEKVVEDNNIKSIAKPSILQVRPESPKKIDGNKTKNYHDAYLVSIKSQ